MVIYNVTVQIDKPVHDEWLSWMKAVHIPEVMATGCFLSYELFRIVDDQEDAHTYAIQYRCAGMQELRSYQEAHAPILQAEHRRRYEGHFVAFRSLLEVIHTIDETPESRK